MVPLQNVHEFLFEAGLVYRYLASDWNEVQKRLPGHPYLSPWRRVEENGVAVIEELIQPLAKPVIISQSEHHELQVITRALNKFFVATQKFLTNGHALMPRKEKGDLQNTLLSNYELANSTTKPGYTHPMPLVRLDCLRTPEGFKIVDVNSTRPAGVGEQIVLGIGFADFLEKNQFVLPLEEQFHETVFNCFKQWQATFGKTHLSPKIALALSDFWDDYQNFKILQEGLQRKFGNCEIKVVTKPCDLSGYNLIIRGRIKEGISGYETLRELFPSKCCIITPLYNRYLGNKLWMYYFCGPLASYYQAELGYEDWQALANAFPKTAIVNSAKDSVEFPDERIAIIQLDRKRYLFKPGSGSSAKGVIFGHDVGVEKWLETLRTANANSVVQEFIPCKETIGILDKHGIVSNTNLYTKYGVFILGGNLAGLELMARPSRIVHGARNTYLAPVYVQK